jgi:DNA-binding GntR family transcriptional regulator
MNQVTTAVEIIRERLLSGDFLPGDRLGEEEIAHELDMSRTPVREALRTLAADGLIEIQKNRGARVVDWSEDELISVFEIRMRLEGLAARRAAERAKPEDVVTLTELAKQVQHFSQPAPIRDFAKISRYNGDFHGELLRISGSAALTSAVDRVMFVSVLSRTRQAMDDEAMQRSSNHHFEIVAAVEAGQGDWAESAMRNHILSARTSLFSAMGIAPDAVSRETSFSGVHNKSNLRGVKS